MTLKGFVVLVVVLMVECGVSAQLSGPSALNALRKMRATANWNTSSAKMADFDCDGKPDMVLLGSEKDTVVVGVVWGAQSKQPQVLVFPSGRQTQNGFCSNPKKIETVPLDCQSDSGPLPGCRAAAGCKAFSIPDNGCDAFYFYWDSSRDGVSWWRR
jgi:hypothetical protein